jgi:hypothetical protein
LELPPPEGRLGIPIVESEDKRQLQDANKTALEKFLEEKCHEVHGATISQADFFQRFRDWLDTDERPEWSKTRVGHEMPGQFPKAKCRKDGQNHFGNIAWKSSILVPPKSARLIVKDGKLVPETRESGRQTETEGKALTRLSG